MSFYLFLSVVAILLAADSATALECTSHRDDYLLGCHSARVMSSGTCQSLFSYSESGTYTIALQISQRMLAY